MNSIALTAGLRSNLIPQVGDLVYAWLSDRLKHNPGRSTEKYENCAIMTSFDLDSIELELTHLQRRAVHA